jgi:hypothetical protein
MDRMPTDRKPAAPSAGARQLLGASGQPASPPPAAARAMAQASPPAQAAQGKGAAKSGSILARLGRLLPLSLRSGSQTFTRRHTRHECCIIGTVYLTEKRIPVEGVVLEISQGGVLFRPAAIYILDRTREDVTVEFGGISLPGVIVATRDTGYGVRFARELSDTQLADVLSRFGYRPGERAFGTDMGGRDEAGFGLAMR